jgi:hypothetical protein
VVKVQKRKVREKELNQYESEIRRQCSRVGRHKFNDEWGTRRASKKVKSQFAVARTPQVPSKKVNY